MLLDILSQMNELLWQLVIMTRNCWMIYGGYLHGGIGHFIEMKEHTYQDLTLEFLGTLHVEVARGRKCQAGYILFYL